MIMGSVSAGWALAKLGHTQKNRRLSRVPVFYLLSLLPQPKGQGSGLVASGAID